MAAIRRAMASSSSSRVWGFSGKKSPYCSMKPSKSGSSPLLRWSSMVLRADSMSLNRAISSGETRPIDSVIPLNWLSRSCWRSSSISSWKRWAAAGDTKS